MSSLPSDVAAPPGRAILIPTVFTAAIFVSAGLLFFVQPLFAKLALPHIGGAPAVWTTAMLFFQSVLLAGYLYAHCLVRWLAPRAQVALHLALWAAALAFLPLAVPEGWLYDAEGSTVLQTLTLFALGVGLPFAVLSATAPLIQAWYVNAGGPSSDDPYFLYGASNLGSMTALLAFPLVAEPLFGATAIGRGWAAGFLALGALLLASGLFAAGGPAQPRAGTSAAAARAPRVAPGRMAAWVALAFVPSSLMLALTAKISRDIGAVPLVWVLPLALYLATFVLAFTNRPLVGPRALKAGFVLGFTVLLAAFLGVIDLHRSVAGIALLLPAFLGVALYAHRTLYEARPEGGNLTLFYVMMSVGGALGGLFNSVVAPVAFDRLYEGPVTLAVALALPLLAAGRRPRGRGALLLGAGGCVALLSVAAFMLLRPAPLFQDRSFFGTHLVIDDAATGLRIYSNGTTMHGAVPLADLGAERPRPVSYYHEDAPLARVLTSEHAHGEATIGIVGLGVGALACYAEPGQTWHFYEIDATVARVAWDGALFPFLSRCTPGAETHMGDARIVLEGQDGLRFDVLVIDAYSSDYVPVHLTTTEAMALYMERLAPGGVLVYHISNRYYELDRPLARSAEALGLEMRLQRYDGDAQEVRENPPVLAALIARSEADLGALADDPAWAPVAGDGGRLWTDDYANPLGVLK